MTNTLQGWGSDAPLYIETVNATGFLPDEVPPTSTRGQRDLDHRCWWEETLRKSTDPAVMKKWARKLAAERKKEAAS